MGQGGPSKPVIIGTTALGATGLLAVLVLQSLKSRDGAETAQPLQNKKQVFKMPRKEVKAGSIDHAKFIVDNPGQVFEFFDMEKTKIGEGSYASVTRCTNKSTGAQNALKSIDKARMKNLDRFKQEIAIMKIVDHPNIVKLYETFEDHRCIYLVLELCNGGELFDRIIDAGYFTEIQAAIVMQQILSAMMYMHRMKIAHRDIKPENFMFMSKDPIDKATLKFIDFGLSISFAECNIMTTKAGTPYYVAPQVLAGKYDELADIWSCGVVMYVLLCGYPPFYGETDAEVLTKVRLGNYSFNASDWKNISEDAKDLIRMMLKMNPSDRYTAKQAMNHIWIQNKAPKAEVVSPQASLVNNLRGFASASKLKKLALHGIAMKLDESKIKNLTDVFRQLDANSDGLLCAAEMRDGLTKAGLEIPPDLQQIFQQVDTDNSRLIDYTEFLAATLEKRVYLQEDVCWSAFRVFDRNGDGKISVQELEQVLCTGNVEDAIGTDVVKNIMKDFDLNGDGAIDFEEFMAMMRNGDRDTTKYKTW